MLYSKTTNEIVREHNSFIAKAKETAELVRKGGAANSIPQPFWGQFWNNIADKTDEQAEKIKTTLERINAISLKIYCNAHNAYCQRCFCSFSVESSYCAKLSRDEAIGWLRVVAPKRCVFLGLVRLG